VAVRRCVVCGCACGVVMCGAGVVVGGGVGGGRGFAAEERGAAFGLLLGLLVDDSVVLVAVEERHFEFGVCG